MSIYGKNARRPPANRRAMQPQPCQDSSFIINRRNRFWEVVDPTGALVCITVYKCGAVEVVRRLANAPNPSEETSVDVIPR